MQLNVFRNSTTAKNAADFLTEGLSLWTQQRASDSGRSRDVREVVAAVVPDLLFAFALYCLHVKLNSLADTVTDNYTSHKV